MSDGSTIAKHNENVGPYCYTRGDYRRDDGYRLVLYGAYNANGLIGPEYNGIAVLDDNRQEVWCDNIARADTGWYNSHSTASTFQREVFARLCNLPTPEFVAFVNAQERCRYHVDG